MYVEQLLADGRDPKESLWFYPNSAAARKAAAQEGKTLVGFEITFL